MAEKAKRRVKMERSGAVVAKFIIVRLVRK